MERRRHEVLLFILMMIYNSCNLLGVCNGLEVGFYSSSCPQAEAVVGEVVRQAGAADKNNLPMLLRLHFHDCFVAGCDGSILIDGDERSAFAHQGVGGFDIIETAKAQLEEICPATVSCADIVALAARDAVFLAAGGNGRKSWYEVETGRKDGFVSNKTLADDMPDVDDSILDLRSKFARKGLTDNDLVLLSAAHTIGTTACFFMTRRLYGGGAEPSRDAELKSACPENGDVNARLAIDRGSGEAFDDQILRNIRNGLAVLQSDAALYEDDATRRVVDWYLGAGKGGGFRQDFGGAMVKMGRIGVVSGLGGTVRRVCSSFNS